VKKSQLVKAKISEATGSGTEKTAGRSLLRLEAQPQNIDRPRVKGAFHRPVEQSKAGQD
jgi:hypothetical protein